MPLQDDVQIVSVDDHVIEHPGVFQDRLPEKFKERGPTIVHTPEGHDIWMYDGVPHPTIGLNAVAGKAQEDDRPRPGALRRRCAPVATTSPTASPTWTRRRPRPGVLPVASRASPAATFFKAPDKELAACVREAWNDWMIDEWCAGIPGRQIPLAIVPYWDIDADASPRPSGYRPRAPRRSRSPRCRTRSGLPSFHTDHWDTVLRRVQGRRPAGVPPLRQRRRAERRARRERSPSRSPCSALNSQMATMTDLMLSRSSSASRT